MALKRTNTLSVLRYPGGKRWFVPYAEQFIKVKRPKVFLEPFAGGATVALTLLWKDLVDSAVLVELDPRVAAFWKRAINDPTFADQVKQFKCTRENVEAVVNNPDKDPGFWTLVKNRCSYGGLLDGGLLQLGGKKDGVYQGVSSRWNSEVLYEQLQAIHSLSSRLSIIEGDGISQGLEALNDPDNAAFIDPPYSMTKASKGKELYKHYEIEHGFLFSVMARWNGRWIATYDDQPEVRSAADLHTFAYRNVPMRTTSHSLKYELVIGRQGDIDPLTPSVREPVAEPVTPPEPPVEAKPTLPHPKPSRGLLTASLDLLEARKSQTLTTQEWETFADAVQVEFGEYIDTLK